MNPKHYKLILYIVAFTIVATLVVQGYWNYVIYKANKEDLVNQVQLSLDNALETYYAGIARKHNVTVISERDSINHFTYNKVDELIRHQHVDDTASLDSAIFIKNKSFSYTSRDTIIMEMETTDSMEISMLATKLFVSVNNEQIDFEKLAVILSIDFDEKNWPLDFGLELRNKDCNHPMFGCDTLTQYGLVTQKNQLYTKAQSALIPPGSELKIYFSNINSILFQKSLLGILLSLLLAGTVVFCLLYLFRVIKNQKQLAEIKDDLISNITHEFKTPITTVVAALEGIENFSAQHDKEKTKKYVQIGNEQLSKLNTMVEKLLDTASLDSEHLVLNKELINLNTLLQQQIEKIKATAINKEISLELPNNNIALELDAFHFESAVSNLLDNAIKYGGEKIAVSVKANTNSISVQIIDNGGGISKHEQVRIFDKFYRIPTGNVHNVKGFGIGLYYAKNIIEKHEGTLTLYSTPEETNFTITLPYAN